MAFIETPNQQQLHQLRDDLAEMASDLDMPTGEQWPARQLKVCADRGVFRWFLAKEWGGCEWTPEQTAEGYLSLSAGCLTTTFVITQYMGAARRIAGSENQQMKERYLPKFASGELFGTVGISHLTTSRRHLGKNILHAEEVGDGFRLNGMAPWVTGAKAADTVVTGATLDDGRQILAAVPNCIPGIEIPPPAQLVSLNASQTGPIKFEDCWIPNECVLAGPVNEVMKTGVGAGTGGVQTSTLAVGLANGAISYLKQEVEKRPDLSSPAEALADEANQLSQQLLRAAAGEEVCSNEELRTKANSLALRSTQSALSAAKGTGYLIGHPAGRWCREALFFLVWSCPQPVINANLCELAGLA
jgi:alkylation response protein AidB-like acyl-CoA dehydrogenase